MEHKNILVIYHKHCPDGFGAAYAAWTKFGDAAEYVPASYGDDVPAETDGREVYVVDFCFDQPGAIEELQRRAKRTVILDHHEGARAITESVPEHVYDVNRSGASIAWTYFHPETKIPYLIQLLEDGDTYRYALADTSDFYSYLIVQPYDFKLWDEITEKLEAEAGRKEIIGKGAVYTEYFDLLADMSVKAAKKVRFEGFECYFATTLPHITMRSHVANLLYTKLPPIALVVTAHPDGFGVSIRGDGTVDVNQIAKKYGGGGHHSSAGFFIPNGTPVPWVEIED